MRYSDGVKKYNEETKKRLFDEIIAAAEKEMAAEISLDDNDTTTTGDDRKEEITMRRTEDRAMIRSSKGGIIAAACALVVVGSGLAAANHMSGSNDIRPASAGSSMTTDAEDIEYSDDSDAEEADGDAEGKIVEKEKKDTDKKDAEDKKKDNDDDRSIDEDYWRMDATEDEIRLVDGSDFIGDVQIVNIMKEEIDGKNYVAYYCSLTDENNNGGLIYKYTGSEVLSRICILQEDPGSDIILPKVGDKIFVMAKNGVKSTSGGYSLELTEDGTIYKWNNDIDKYVNVFKPGHFIGENEEGIYGEYVNGLYEHEVDEYYKSMIVTMTNGDDSTTVENWCKFNNEAIRKVMVSGQDHPKGTLLFYRWFGYCEDDPSFNGITLEYSDGTSYTGTYDGGHAENTDENTNDSREENKPENKTEERTDNKTENKPAVNDLPAGYIELNVECTEKTETEFDDYNIGLGRLYYDTIGSDYYVVFSLTKKDGSVFTQAELDEAPIDLVYGDLEPYFHAINPNELSMGFAKISENDPTVAEISLMAETNGEPYYVKNAPIDIVAIRVGDREISGHYNVMFTIDVNNVKQN